MKTLLELLADPFMAAGLGCAIVGFGMVGYIFISEVLEERRARCRYTDCPRGLRVARVGETVTCPDCRDWLGLEAI
jgi:hypothetical protein